MAEKTVNEGASTPAKRGRPRVEGVRVSARVPEELASRIDELGWTLRIRAEADVVKRVLEAGVTALEAQHPAK